MSNMHKVTKKMLEKRLQYLSSVLGVSDWRIDYVKQYGGYLIETEKGKHPFGPDRLKAEELYDRMHFALRAIQMDRAGGDSAGYWPEVKKGGQNDE